MLPFAVQTVSAITTNDGNGVVAETEYTYEDGLYDYDTREFRGFGKVVQTNPNGTVVESLYHQDEFRKGRQYQEDLTASDGSTPLTHTTFDWYPQDPEQVTEPYAFVKLAQKRTESYDAQTVFAQEDYTYDNAHGGVLTAIVSGTGAEDVTTTNTYANYGDWAWRKTQETITGASTGQVRQTTFAYESGTGNLLSKTFWNDQGTGNPQVVMTYDTYGNLSTETDARSNTTTYEYETTAYTFPWRITYPSTSGVSHVVENTLWDYRFGKVAQTKDENGNLTDYGYDEFGRIESVDYPDGGQTLTAYYDNVVPRYTITRVLEASPSTYIDKYEYADGFGRPIQQITFGESSQAIASRQYYDTMGRQYLTQGPFFASGYAYPQAVPTEYPWSQTTFDERDRPTQIQTPDDEQTNPVSTTYSYSGLSTTITDPDGGMKKETRDYLDRIGEVVEYGESQEAFTTTYAYNAAGDLLTVTDALANVTTLTFDSLGRKISMTDPDMGYWSYTYDANGNLSTQTDAKGQVITFAYDELNRIASKTYSTSDPAVTYAYDSASVTNGKGRLSSVSTTNATTAYGAYDAMGRETMVTKTITGAPSAYTTSYAYGRAGQIEQLTYPDSFALDYAYHAGSGLLHTATGSDNVVYATFTGYEPTGKMGQVDCGNGVATSFAYYPKTTRLETIWTEDSSQTLLQNRTYHYFPSGDIHQIDDGRTLANYTYTYDPLHRLASETATNAVQTFTDHVLDFDHSAAGPIHAADGATVNGEVFTYAYDANGNMISGWDFTDPLNPATRTIAYNADNMPETITHSANGTTTIDYDGESQRVKKTVGGTDTYYINKYFEVEGTSAVKYVFAGNQRIARIAGADTRYFHQDHLGSATVVTYATGAQAEGSEYLPFGGQRSHSGTVQAPYKFTDQELDASTGLYNYDARLYDPGVGRFVTPDTVIPCAPFDSQFLNRYFYANNSPLNYTDPSGHWATDPDTGEQVESDPSDYDKDTNNNNNGSFRDVDKINGDDPGELGWGLEDSNGWINISSIYGDYKVAYNSLTFTFATYDWSWDGTNMSKSRSTNYTFGVSLDTTFGERTDVEIGFGNRNMGVGFNVGEDDDASFGPIKGVTFHFGTSLSPSYGYGTYSKDNKRGNK